MAQQYTLLGEPAIEPYKDPELLRKLYHSEGLSLRRIAEKLDCHFTTVHEYMEEFGIERREAQYEPAKADQATYSQHNKGYEMWADGSDIVLVHRLIAVAEEGFDAVCNGIIHHENGIEWDNRPSNLAVLNSHREHNQIHNQPEVPSVQATLED